MNMKKLLAPAARVLASNPDSRGFMPLSLLIIVLLRIVVLYWGLHNPFHIVYLLIGFTFLQVGCISGPVARGIKDSMTPEEHRQMRNSSILLGYVWSLLLYLVLLVILIITYWQIQLGVEWPLSTYVPDAFMLLLIASISFLHFPLTVSAFFWQWNSFKTSDESAKLVLDKGMFRRRTGVVLLSLMVVLVLFYCLRATIEGDVSVLSWISPPVLGVVILFIMVVLGTTFWYEFRKDN